MTKAEPISVFPKSHVISGKEKLTDHSEHVNLEILAALFSDSVM